jgi:hypothetical protein
MTGDAQGGIGSEITSVADVLAVSEAVANGVAVRAHTRLWCRGHAKTGWKLEPGVYRWPKVKTEGERLRRERHLTQDFRVFSANLRQGVESDEDIYFLQQHYRMPTRLLDWTTNPLAALYFATVEHPDDDGEFFIMDAYQLSTTQNAADEFAGIATSRHPLIKNSVKIISAWVGDAKTFTHHIMPVRPDHFDNRIIRQLGYFTFHVPKRPALTVAENKTLKRYKVPAAAKAKLKSQLALLGVNHFTVYGDLDHLAEWLKGAHG